MNVGRGNIFVINAAITPLAVTAVHVLPATNLMLITELVMVRDGVRLFYSASNANNDNQLNEKKQSMR